LSDVYDFGVRLRTLREAKGLSQSQMATLLGIARTTIASYESNVALPSCDMLKALAVFFRVSADYLLGLDDRPCLYLDGFSESESRAIAFIVERIAADFKK